MGLTGRFLNHGRIRNPWSLRAKSVGQGGARLVVAVADQFGGSSGERRITGIVLPSARST